MSAPDHELAFLKAHDEARRKYDQAVADAKDAYRLDSHKYRRAVSEAIRTYGHEMEAARDKYRETVPFYARSPADD